MFENHVQYFPAHYASRENNERHYAPTDRAFIFKAKSHTLEPIDQKGIYAIASEYSEGLRNFSYGGMPGRSGYLDTYGKVAIKPQFQGGSNFQDGNASVVILAEESYPGANLRVIDKSGKMVPTGDLVLGRRWNGFYIVDGLNKEKGVVNREFKWILKPEFDLILARTDGTYIASKTKDKKVSVYSNSGTELATMSFDELDRRRMFYRCVPKSEYNPSIGKQAEAGVLSTQYPFDSPSAIEVVSNGLVAHCQPYPPIGWDSQLNRPISPTLAAQLYSRVVEAQSEPDRYVMSNARGTYCFDSIRWKEIQNISGSPPLPPTKSLLMGYYGDALDLFSRFLYEHNLVGMSRQEVLRLLGPKNPNVRTIQPSLRYMILSGGCCLDRYIYVDINFQNEIVCDWCFSGSDGKKSAPFVNNVVLVPEICTAEYLTNIGPPRANHAHTARNP